MAKSGRRLSSTSPLFIAVGESMRERSANFANNVGGSLRLLTAMVQAGRQAHSLLVHGRVYGIRMPIRFWNFPIQPVSPYGESKVMVETLLGWFDRIHI